jgi:hypothetical protein
VTKSKSITITLEPLETLLSLDKTSNMTFLSKVYRCREKQPFAALTVQEIMIDRRAATAGWRRTSSSLKITHRTPKCSRDRSSSVKQRDAGTDAEDLSGVPTAANTTANTPPTPMGNRYERLPRALASAWICFGGSLKYWSSAGHNQPTMSSSLHR